MGHNLFEAAEDEEDCCGEDGGEGGRLGSHGAMVLFCLKEEKVSFRCSLRFTDIIMSTSRL